ncbi:MAG: hypothetical protein HYV76_02945 [Candidatus Vogelbacteria bacterium]|nr:hypothetical protein [Candidatus Vogelbacteria bacterium]
MTKHFLIIVICSLVLIITTSQSVTVLAQNSDYILLEPQIIGRTENNVAIDFVTYAKELFNMAFVVAVSLAIFMLVLSGVYYIVSYAPGALSEAESMWTNALWGLAIAIGAYTLLYTINPKLLDFNFTITRTPATTGTFGGSGSGGLGYNTGTNNGNDPNHTITPINAVTSDFTGVPQKIFEQVAKVNNLTDVNQRESVIRSDVLGPNGVMINNPCPTTCVGGWTNETVWVANGINLGLQNNGVSESLVITGGSEVTGHSGGSSHYNGYAIDIRSNDAGIRFYQDYQNLNQTDFRNRYGFSRDSITVLDETRGQYGGSGPHYHIEALTNPLRNDINSFKNHF